MRQPTSEELQAIARLRKLPPGDREVKVFNHKDGIKITPMPLIHQCLYL